MLEDVSGVEYNFTDKKLGEVDMEEVFNAYEAADPVN
jgi:hypothetical protein